MHFTEAQQLAIDSRDHNVILVAGAGSGKTRVLVERYLGLLEANPSWPLSALVAITFTKKAAEEMRDRVRFSLESRLNDPERGTEVDRWASLLSQIDSARIDTIHGLCATILRANAAHIGIDPAFTVIDEVESAILLEDVVDSVLAQLVSQDADELRLIAHYGQQRVRNLLTNNAIVNATIPDGDNDWLAQWNRRWHEVASVALDQFLSHPAISNLGQLTLPDGDLLSEICVQALSALDRISSASELDVCFEALGHICGINLRGGSAKNWGSSEQVAYVRSILRQLRDDAQAIQASIGEQPGEIDRQAAELLPLWCSILRTVQDAFAETKLRQAVLDFDDLERLTCDLLTNHANVRSRYRNTEFKHLLVDEFQDTNARQWQIVQSLAALDQPGTLFVVGDQKQSIYAFRGADVSVFGDVRAQIVNSGGRAVQMARSFRTHESLVNAFNMMFDHLLFRDERSPVAPYQVVMDTPMNAQRKDVPHDEPIISLILINKREHIADGQTGEDEGETLSAEARRQWEAQAIAGHIQRMMADGVHVHDDGDGADASRPVQYGDFAILFQSMTQVAIYESVFAEAGIPYVTVAGRGYYDRQEVWDLLNLLRSVYNPADDLSLAAALRSPLFSLSDNALLALRLQTDVNPVNGHSTPMRLWNALSVPGEYFPDDELVHLRFAERVLKALQAIAGRVTIYELLSEALSLTGYLATLSGLPQGTRMRGNVEKLLAKAQERGNVTLASFTKYLGDMSEREVREGEAAAAMGDAVQLMTVHKSKGLEFPVVIIADASWTQGSGGGEILLADDKEGWACQIINPETMQVENPFMYRLLKQYASDRDAAERLRLLYVAATRARDYLVISGQAAPTKDSEWRANGWLGQLLEVFELYDAQLNVGENLLPFTWGKLRVSVPAQRIPVEAQHATPDYITGWDNAEWDTSTPTIPPLIHEISIETDQRVKHLAASHIMSIGEIMHAVTPENRRTYINRFRQRLLHNAPEWVEEFEYNRRNPSARIIGDIVHEALRFGQLPATIDKDELIAILRNYAWRRHITTPDICDRVAQRAYKLLQKYETSPVHQWMSNAAELYQELPFVLEIEGFIIHGIIDALIHTQDGRWIVVDYKTGFVPANSLKLAEYARPYHLQLGVYALAVETQLGGVTPDVYIHFIQRPQQPVRIPENEWRATLQRHLREQIREILKDDKRD